MKSYKSVDTKKLKSASVEAKKVSSTLMCTDFCKSPVPELHEMDDYLFVEYVGQGKRYPQRIKSAKSCDVSSIQLTYLTNSHLNYMNTVSRSLKILDLSNSCLYKVPFELIKSLESLKILILDKNDLNNSSFCNEFSVVFSHNLKELNASYNNFTAIPTAFQSIPKLSRLKLTNNLIMDVKGIENFKRLSVLSLEHNQIQNLGMGYYSLKRLEYCYFTHNKVASLSASIKQMTHLREIDFSYNSLKTVPSDLFLLFSLELLKLNNNKLTKIPKFKASSRGKKCIGSIDLSHNSISQFPEAILKVCVELDLTYNKIKQIPQFVLKKIPYNSRKTLLIHNNPISYPPLDICTSGLQNMIQYYNESQSLVYNYQGLKLFALAAAKSMLNEKSKVIQNLISLHDFDDATEDVGFHFEINDASFDVEVDSSDGSNKNNKQISKTLNYHISDVHSNIQFKELTSLFFNKVSIFIVFVNLDQEVSISEVTFWLNMLLVKNNELAYLIVGYTTGRIFDVEEKYKNILNQISDQYWNKYWKNIDNIIEQIENQENITPAMSKALKRIIQLKSAKVYLSNCNLTVNIHDKKSIEKLKNQLIALSKDKNFFPDVLSKIPTFWTDVQIYFEEESYQFPIITYKEFEQLLHEKFNLKRVASKICTFLHNSGTILWWGTETTSYPLSNWVVANPQSLLDIIELLCDPTLQIKLNNIDDPDKKCQKFRKRFPHSQYSYEESCKILTEQGILLPELAVILFIRLTPESALQRLLYYLCKCLNLGFPYVYSGYSNSKWDNLYQEVDDAKQDSVSVTTNSNSLNPSNSIPNISIESRIKSVDWKLTCLPPIKLALLFDNLTDENADHMSNMENDNQLYVNNEEVGNYLVHGTLCVGYKFPMHLPGLIFRTSLIKLINFESLQYQLMKYSSSEIRMKQMETGLTIHIAGCWTEIGTVDLVSVKIDGNFKLKQNYLTPKSSKLLWDDLLNFLHCLDEIYETYKGLWFERVVQCPNCTQFSFIGSWNVPNNNSNEKNPVCCNCGTAAQQCLVEQPQSQYKISSEEIIRKIRKQFNRDEL